MGKYMYTTSTSYTNKTIIQEVDSHGECGTRRHGEVLWYCQLDGVCSQGQMLNGHKFGLNNAAGQGSPFCSFVLELPCFTTISRLGFLDSVRLCDVLCQFLLCHVVGITSHAFHLVYKTQMSV